MSQSDSNGFILLAAPLQGYTEAPFRHFHAQIYGNGGKACLTYFTPFVRIEKGEVRTRDMRDVTTNLNSNHQVIPQIIARDADEFRLLTQSIQATGHTHIDLNLGCPFVPQVRKGRGAGLLSYPDRLRKIADCMKDEFPEIKFSVKMRLGIRDPWQWRNVISILDSMPLTHITVHPRTAEQKYNGQLHTDILNEFTEATHHRLIYNGEITTPEMLDKLSKSVPRFSGAMIGRGLLRRPSLPAEWYSGSEWPLDEQRHNLLRLHNAILNYYNETLCGDTQILTKIRPLWDYFGDIFDRKAIKKVLKSNTLTAYRQNISLI